MACRRGTRLLLVGLVLERGARPSRPLGVVASGAAEHHDRTAVGAAPPSRPPRRPAAARRTSRPSRRRRSGGVTAAIVGDSPSRAGRAGPRPPRGPAAHYRFGRAIDDDPDDDDRVRPSSPPGRPPLAPPVRARARARRSTRRHRARPSRRPARSASAAVSGCVGAAAMLVVVLAIGGLRAQRPVRPVETDPAVGTDGPGRRPSWPSPTGSSPPSPGSTPPRPTAPRGTGVVYPRRRPPAHHGRRGRRRPTRSPSSSPTAPTLAAKLVGSTAPPTSPCVKVDRPSWPPPSLGATPTSSSASRPSPSSATPGRSARRRSSVGLDQRPRPPRRQHDGTSAARHDPDQRAGADRRLGAALIDSAGAVIGLVTRREPRCHIGDRRDRRPLTRSTPRRRRSCPATPRPIELRQPGGRRAHRRPAHGRRHRGSASSGATSTDGRGRRSGRPAARVDAVMPGSPAAQRRAPGRRHRHRPSTRHAIGSSSDLVVALRSAQPGDVGRRHLLARRRRAGRPSPSLVDREQLAPSRCRARTAAAPAAQRDRPGDARRPRRADGRAPRRRERQLLAAARAQRGQRAARVGLDVGLLVGVRRAPSPSPAADRWPPPTGGGCRAARPADGVGPSRAAQRVASRPASRAGRCTRPRGRRGRAARRPVSQPSGATLNGPSSRCAPGEVDRRRRGRRGAGTAPAASAPAGPQRRRRPRRRAPATRSTRRRPTTAGRSTATGGAGVARPRHSAASRSTSASCRRVGEPGVGSQRRVLGERHRVVGPGAVDHRARQRSRRDARRPRRPRRAGPGVAGQVDAGRRRRPSGPTAVADARCTRHVGLASSAFSSGSSRSTARTSTPAASPARRRADVERDDRGRPGVVGGASAATRRPAARPRR